MVSAITARRTFVTSGFPNVSCDARSRISLALGIVQLCIGFLVAPMSSRGDGRSRMLETWVAHRRMRLYRFRLDMRACHPASRIWMTELATFWGFHAPLPGFHEERGQFARIPPEDKWNTQLNARMAWTSRSGAAGGGFGRLGNDCYRGRSGKSAFGQKLALRGPSFHPRQFTAPHAHSGTPLSPPLAEVPAVKA